MDVTSISPKQLRKAADLKERIDTLQSELSQLLGAPDVAGAEPSGRPENGRRKTRRLSPQGLVNSRAGVARTMAKKTATAGAQPTPQSKKKRSAAWSKALSEALKKRWAERKAAGQTRL